MSLIGWWKFEDSPASSLRGDDASIGDADYVDGFIGRSLDVVANSNTNRVEFRPFSLDLNLHNESISFWMKADFPRADAAGGGFSNWMVHWGDYHTSNSGGIGFQSGIAHFYFRGPDAGGWTNTGPIPLANPIYDEGGWIHYVVVFEENTVVKFYMNGELVRTISLNNPWTGYSYDNITIGRDLLATIDDVKIYDHALSPQEIKNLSQAKVAHWKFNDFQDYTENLATNGAFNDGLSGWATSAHNNTVYDHVVEVITDNTAPHGDKVLRMWREYHEGEDFGYVRINNTFNDADVGDTISFSGWCKILDKGIGRPGLALQQGGVTKLSITANENMSGWQFLEGSFTVDVAGDWRIYITYSHGTEGESLWNGMQWEIKPKATPFTPSVRTGKIKDASPYSIPAIELDADSPAWTSDSAIGSGCYIFLGEDWVETPFEVIHDYPFTFSFWVKTDDFNHNGDAISWHDTASRYYSIGVQNGVWQLEARDSTRVYVNSFEHTVPNVWHHVVGVFRAPDDRELYINGDMVGTDNTNVNFVDPDVFFIGRQRYFTDGHGPRFWQGEIDDPRIYVTALSAEDVQNLYQKRASLDSYGNFNSHHLIETKHVPMLADHTTWEVGIGSAPGFGQNGSTDENHRILGIDPWGKEVVIWEARPDDVSDADGGWNTTSVPVDNTKMYRISVWVNRTVAGSDGRFYLGTHGFGSTNGVYFRDTGDNSTNPYFFNTLSGGLIEGEWILVIGHIWPAGSGTGADFEDSGLWLLDGTKHGNIHRDMVFREETTTARHRSYLFYTTDTTVRQQWVYPRMDLCDGTEPTLSDILNGIDSRNYDYVRSIGGSTAQSFQVGANSTRISHLNEVDLPDSDTKMRQTSTTLYVPGQFNEVSI